MINDFIFISPLSQYFLNIENWVNKADLGEYHTVNDMAEYKQLAPMLGSFYLFYSDFKQALNVLPDHKYSGTHVLINPGNIPPHIEKKLFDSGLSYILENEIHEKEFIDFVTGNFNPSDYKQKPPDVEKVKLDNDTKRRIKSDEIKIDNVEKQRVERLFAHKFNDHINTNIKHLTEPVIAKRLKSIFNSPIYHNKKRKPLFISPPREIRKSKFKDQIDSLWGTQYQDKVFEPINRKRKSLDRKAKEHKANIDEIGVAPIDIDVQEEISNLDKSKKEEVYIERSQKYLRKLKQEGIEDQYLEESLKIRPEIIQDLDSSIEIYHPGSDLNFNFISSFFNLFKHSNSTKEQLLNALSLLLERKYNACLNIFELPEYKCILNNQHTSINAKKTIDDIKNNNLIEDYVAPFFTDDSFSNEENHFVYVYSVDLKQKAMAITTIKNGDYQLNIDSHFTIEALLYLVKGVFV